MTKIGEHYFLVVNTAKKIIVLDTSFVQIAEINNLNSPRFAIAAGSNKMYVSDLYADMLTVVNTQDYSVSKTIKLKGWSEQMCSINNQVYVCDYDSSKLYVIDTNTDAVTDSIDVGKGAEYLVKDMNDHLWVLCTSIFNTEKKYLKCIDVNTKSILHSFEFSTTESPTALQINAAGDQLYYINKHVYSMNINSTALPSAALVTADANMTFYALGVNPENENLYVSDSKYGQAFDHIYVHKKTGERITTFESGYITGYFYFDVR
jgi:YVTN family beta-propeller protein